MAYSPRNPNGQATMANSEPVVIASNQSTLAVSMAQDVMLGTDFSDVLGTASLILGTQADDIANTVDGLQTSSFGYIFDGATWDRMPGNSTDGTLVNLGANNDVTITSGTITAVTSITNALPAGTNNIGDVDILTIAAGTNYIGKVRLTDGTLDSSLVDETGASAVDALAVGGGTPHGSVDSGNPIKMGFKAANALPTAEANADRVNGIADLWGRQMTTHIDPAQQKHANKNYTSAQTGTDVITPTSGKKLAITSVTIGAYGTTAGRVILWFGDNADTTFTQDTDQVLVAASFAPSANSKPGLSKDYTVPVFCTTADRELHITTDAAISLDVTIEYYEW